MENSKEKSEPTSFKEKLEELEAVKITSRDIFEVVEGLEAAIASKGYFIPQSLEDKLTKVRFHLLSGMDSEEDILERQKEAEKHPFDVKEAGLIFHMQTVTASLNMLAVNQNCPVWISVQPRFSSPEWPRYGQYFVAAPISADTKDSDSVQKHQK